MLTHLLRRLQGRPADAMRSAEDAARPGVVDDAPGDAEAEAATLIAPDVLAAGFVRHLLDVAHGQPRIDGLADDLLARLTVQAEHLDVARLPRLPALVPQLLSALRRDDTDANALAALLARDPTLAAAVVRVANSAQYACGARVSSLPKAVGVVGNEGLRYVVLTSVMRPILHADPAQQGARTGERLAQVAEARTWLCGALAATEHCDAGEAQLTSVIASTGRAARLRMMPHRLLAQAAPDPSFAMPFLALAASIAARAAAHWRLDAELCAALVATSADRADGADPTPLARTLIRADRLSMLHALRMADDIDDDAQVSPGAMAAQDARLLAALRDMQETGVEA